MPRPGHVCRNTDSSMNPSLEHRTKKRRAASPRARRASRISLSGIRRGGAGIPCVQKGVAEFELGGVVVPDVPGLRGPEPLEPLAVAVERFEPVVHLAEPEVEVRDLTGELMSVEGDEPR